jgi:hypothetical protein
MSNTIRDILRLVDDYAQGFDVGAPEPTIEDIESAITAYILGEVEKLIGADEDIDKIDDIEDWEYYDLYTTNANDFVKGYNKSKQELRNKANKKFGGK